MKYFLEDTTYFLYFVLELLDCCECVTGNNEKVVSMDVHGVGDKGKSNSRGRESAQFGRVATVSFL